MKLDWSKKPFTYNYAQPSEYRFSLDSIEVPWLISHLFKDQSKPLKVADLCAGCGVMGFELSFHMPCITEVDFVEVQSAYNEYFQQNIAITSSKKENFRFHNINVTEVAASLVLHSYDIVLCNPPYFWPGAGVFSPSELKNRSRFLLDCTFENIVTSMLTLLSEGGSGFLLVRDLSVNGVNQMELLEKCIEGKARIEGKYLVRGRTGLVWFSAKAKQDSIL